VLDDPKAVQKLDRGPGHQQTQSDNERFLDITHHDEVAPDPAPRGVEYEIDYEAPDRLGIVTAHRDDDIEGMHRSDRWSSLLSTQHRTRPFIAPAHRISELSRPSGSFLELSPS